MRCGCAKPSCGMSASCSTIQTVQPVSNHIAKYKVHALHKDKKRRAFFVEHLLRFPTPPSLLQLAAAVVRFAMQNVSPPPFSPSFFVLEHFLCYYNNRRLLCVACPVVPWFLTVMQHFSIFAFLLPLSSLPRYALRFPVRFPMLLQAALLHFR